MGLDSRTQNHVYDVQRKLRDIALVLGDKQTVTDTDYVSERFLFHHEHLAITYQRFAYRHVTHEGDGPLGTTSLMCSSGNALSVRVDGSDASYQYLLNGTLDPATQASLESRIHSLHEKAQQVAVLLPLLPCRDQMQ